MTKELILLGKGRTSVCVDDYWAKAKRPELWTLNDVVDDRSRWHFEIHEGQDFGDLYEEVHRAGWVVSPFARVTEMEARMSRFPLREVYQTFGVAYFECTLDYMLAMALLMQKRRQERWERIMLPGFDMADAAHCSLRTGVSFWLGVARGLEVDLQIPRRSTLLKRVVSMPPVPHGDPEFPHAYGQSRESTEKVAEQYNWLR